MNLDEQIRLNITEESLSPKFENIIVENGDQIIIRSNLKSMEDINEWVKELGIRTDSHWNSRKSQPKGDLFAGKKKFVCQHSSFNKITVTKNMKGISKNAECQAFVTVKIKLDTTQTRRSDDFIRKLKEKITIYTKVNVTVAFKENPFAVAVLTPIMKRAHSLKTSEEIIFVDSTSSCDAENHTITFMLTPCSAGAVPVGIFITKGQTEESYKQGLNLMNVCGKNFPAVEAKEKHEIATLALGQEAPSVAFYQPFRLNASDVSSFDSCIDEIAPSTSQPFTVDNHTEHGVQPDSNKEEKRES
ncbi:unnamed protein product [Larinioides sclopetarius]|uniref:Uncharacterized protein n=1 Tax=Larinioides sclopetarius TaxID=280406 RepID=A0AAV2AQP3_9ARAC